MKKVLLIGILTLFFAIPALSQIISPEEDQSVPAPFIRLFGTQWALQVKETIKLFDDLGIKLEYIFIRDLNSRAGIVKLLVVSKGEDKEKFVGGWIKPFTQDEQGFSKMKGDWYLTKTLKEGENLEWELGQDKDGSPLIIFYLNQKEYNKSTKTTTNYRMIIEHINVKKFIEENPKE